MLLIIFLPCHVFGDALIFSISITLVSDELSITLFQNGKNSVIFVLIFFSSVLTCFCFFFYLILRLS